MKYSLQNQKAVDNAECAPTLYPKITGKTADVFRAIKSIDPPPSTSSIQVTGTVKLHGTHGDIVFPSLDSSEFHIQSRNRARLSEALDNHGFASYILKRKASILSLRDSIISHYTSLNPSTDPTILAVHPLIIAGEFIGKFLLSGTAINSAPGQFFVILGLQICGEWQRDEDYTAIHDESAGIYHISRGGFFHETLDISSENPSIENLLTHMRAVARHCPFAYAVFGMDGIGEGIVWKPHDADSRVLWTPQFWLKTKALEFWATQTKSISAANKGQSRKEDATAFAHAVCSEMRLEQGLEWLEEMHLPKNMASFSRFLNWVWEDVQSEEGAEMKELTELGVQEKWIRGAMGKIAAEWFKRVAEEQIGRG